MKKLSFLKTVLVLFVLSLSVSAFAGEPAKDTEKVDSPTWQIVVVDTENEKDDDKGDKEDPPKWRGMRGVWDG